MHLVHLHGGKALQHINPLLFSSMFLMDLAEIQNKVRPDKGLWPVELQVSEKGACAPKPGKPQNMLGTKIYSTSPSAERRLL